MNSLRERKKKKKQWKGKIKKLVEHLLMNLVFLLAVPASKSRNPSSWKTRVGSRSSRSNCFSRIRPILIHYGRDTTGWRRPSRSLPPLMLQQYGYEIFDRNLYFDIVIDSFKQQILARLFLCLVTSVSINCCRYFVSSFYHDWNWSSPPPNHPLNRRIKGEYSVVFFDSSGRGRILDGTCQFQQPKWNVLQLQTSPQSFKMVTTNLSC